MSASTWRLCATTAATMPEPDCDEQREVAADQRGDQLVQLFDGPEERGLLVVLHRLVVDGPEAPRQGDGEPERDRGGDRDDEVPDATRAPQPPRDGQRDRNDEHLDRERGAHREPGRDRTHHRGAIAVREREPRGDRGERDCDAVAGDRAGGPQHGAGRRGQPAREAGTPARRAEATRLRPTPRASPRCRRARARHAGRSACGTRAGPRRTGSAGAADLAARRPRGTGARRAASRARWRRTRRRRRGRGAARRTWGAGSPARTARGHTARARCDSPRVRASEERSRPSQEGRRWVHEYGHTPW